MPNYEYKDFMIFTGTTDRDLGRRYRCPLCGKRCWTAWGHARRHFEKEMRLREKEVTEIIEGEMEVKGMAKYTSRTWQEEK